MFLGVIQIHHSIFLWLCMDALQYGCLVTYQRIFIWFWFSAIIDTAATDFCLRVIVNTNILTLLSSKEGGCWFTEEFCLTFWNSRSSVKCVAFLLPPVQCVSALFVSQFSIHPYQRLSSLGDGWELWLRAHAQHHWRALWTTLDKEKYQNSKCKISFLLKRYFFPVTIKSKTVK